jgi:tetratricopeptide (TPR) repeat protein
LKILRSIVIALGLGVGIVLLLPKLIEPKEINFTVYATIQAQPKNSLQAEESQYQHALRLASDDPFAALDLLNGIAFSESEFSEDARILSLAIRAAQIEDDLSYTYTVVGQALAQINAWDLSRSALEKAVEADPEYAEAWAYLGETQQQLGEDGLDALQKAKRLNPRSIAANLFLALYWQRQVDYDEAMRFLNIALFLDPENTQIVLEQGRTSLLAGNVLEARAYFEQAVDMAPEDLLLWKALASYSLDNDIYLEEIGIPASRRALILNAQDPEALLLVARASFKSLALQLKR